MARHAIEVDHVSKQFRMNTERHSSLKERVVKLRRRQPAVPFDALKDIHFDVEEGHTVGLIGHNGSGKSTLLKCIGGILQPTSGEIRTRGRMASLLELGAGFHPDLTGRENVFLNASILGMSKRDIAKRFDDIVGFAELEKFIDQQVKHYSSGMYVRLGFSVATNVDPDILLVDEVLAVGDEAFQRKCLDRIKTFQKDGRTIVFVTHGADLIRQICDRGVVLDTGEMVVHADPSEAVRVFREHLLVGTGPHAGGDEDTSDKPDQRVKITDVAIEYPDPARPFVRNGEPLTVRIAYRADEPVPDAVFVLSLHGSDGHVVFGQNSYAAGYDLPPLQGEGEVAFVFPSVALLEGTYPLTVGVHGLEGGVVFDWQEQQTHVDVINHDSNHAWGVADIENELDLRKLAVQPGYDADVPRTPRGAIRP
jgi:ABC-2 type transport system ATP-binding protein